MNNLDTVRPCDEYKAMLNAGCSRAMNSFSLYVHSV